MSSKKAACGSEQLGPLKVRLKQLCIGTGVLKGSLLWQFELLKLEAHAGSDIYLRLWHIGKLCAYCVTGFMEL